MNLYELEARIEPDFNVRIGCADASRFVSDVFGGMDLDSTARFIDSASRRILLVDPAKPRQGLLCTFMYIGYEIPLRLSEAAPVSPGVYRLSEFPAAVPCDLTAFAESLGLGYGTGISPSMRLSIRRMQHVF